MRIKPIYVGILVAGIGGALLAGEALWWVWVVACGVAGYFTPDDWPKR